MTTWTQDCYGHHEVNVVFARGTSLDALTGGPRELAREPLDQGEGNGWTWAVHDMLNADGAHTLRIIVDHFGLPTGLRP
ncbi:hypothetical protein [Streptomyces sp. P17]|uniref:hypothetical protein n=1 Tax=Streptomyces sp. P17 TaxID=3074716 RepID=UPI0028F3F231|nr:hypothetical protein [Streptomyces sp. P17]MDT9697606.1 hypothetical protein [Streptomyces sp. P17]